MTPFTRFAYFTVMRDAGFVGLTASVLMLAFSFEPALACRIGATIALIFTVGLLARVYFLTEERLERSEVWRALPEEQRPEGEHGRRWARAHLETLLLRLAKQASGIAFLLYCSALLLALASGMAQHGEAHAFVNPHAPQIALN